MPTAGECVEVRWHVGRRGAGLGGTGGRSTSRPRRPRRRWPSQMSFARGRTSRPCGGTPSAPPSGGRCSAWSFPLEVLWLILNPERHMPTGTDIQVAGRTPSLARAAGCRDGLGAEADAPCSDEARRWLKLGLQHVRRSRSTPLVWHTSTGVALKKNDAAGPRDRVIHVRDPVGKGFFASMVRRRAPAAPSHMDHGF